jgi:hypothetical protein
MNSSGTPDKQLSLQLIQHYYDIEKVLTGIWLKVATEN